jgi:L-lactate permease
MISIANIIAVASITGLSGREGLILRYTIGMSCWSGLIV